MEHLHGTESEGTLERVCRVRVGIAGGCGGVWVAGVERSDPGGGGRVCAWGELQVRVERLGEWA